MKRITLFSATEGRIASPVPFAHCVTDHHICVSRVCAPIESQTGHIEPVNLFVPCRCRPCQRLKRVQSPEACQPAKQSRPNGPQNADSVKAGGIGAVVTLPVFGIDMVRSNNNASCVPEV